MRMSIAVLSIVLGGPALLQAGGAVNHPPDAPVPLSPPDGAVVGTVTPTLEAGAFSDPDPGDGHRTSQWQLALDEGFVDIVCDSGSTNHHRYSVTVGSGASLFADCTLEERTTYCWRVRYSDNASPSHWSPWSEVWCFETTENHSPDAPVPLSPPDGAVVGTVTPTLEAGAFSDPDPGDSHRTSRWQLALDEGFVDIVCDSGSTNHHRYSVTVGSGASLFADCTLDDCTTYYWRVRYSDDYSPSAWSDWSEVRWLHTSVFCPHPCGCVNGDSESFDLKDFLGDLLILGLSLFLLAAWRSTKGI